MPADSERCSGTTALLAYSNYSEPHHLPGPGTQKSKCQKQFILNWSYAVATSGADNFLNNSKSLLQV